MKAVRPVQLDMSHPQNQAVLKAFSTVLAAVHGARKGRKKPFPRGGGGRGGVEPVQLSPLSVLPFNLRCRMFFTEYDNLLATASSGFLKLKINTVYDPDPHIAGGFVPGVTEFGAFYANFRVDAVRVRMSFACTASATLAFGVFWPASVQATGSEGFLTCASQPGARDVVCAGLTTAMETDSGWINMSRLLGRDPAQYAADEKYWGSSSSDPTILAYGNVAMFAPISTNGFCMYSLEFDVTWLNRLELSS